MLLFFDISAGGACGTLRMGHVTQGQLPGLSRNMYALLLEACYMHQNLVRGAHTDVAKEAL